MIKDLMRKTLAMMLAIVVTFGSGAMYIITADAADICGGLEEEDVWYPEPDDIIQDPILNWTIRSAINSIKETKKLTPEIVGDKKADYIFYEGGAHPENFETWTKPWLIKSLEGLQYATKTTKIDISYSANDGKEGLTDLSPLADLTQLYYLKLYKDGITNIEPLRKLVNLNELYLNSNEGLTDISAVSGMKKLTSLDISWDSISDVSAVAELTNLRFLDMAHNQITSLPDLSNLTHIEFINASMNQLTNDDVVKISKLASLQQLDLSQNPDITNVKPLVALVNLEESKTMLPVSAETKADLFAAIKVNQDLGAFNISKMTEDDLDYVKIALDGYDALTDEQKTYLDGARIDAARTNYEKVSNGEDPIYYEEYDQGGVARPVLNRLDISVVDKYGHPLENVKVVRSGAGETTFTTDKAGKVSIPHRSYDGSWEMYITVNAEGYVCKPEKITYEVKNGKTYVINGKRATGFEKLQFVLTPWSEYADKTALAETIAKASDVDEEYVYTEKTYEAYSKALEDAKATYENADATQSDVDTADENLKAAYEALTPNNVLTTIKLNVRDKNGNLFVRAFKLQVIRDAGNGSAWNIWADENGTISDGIARLEVSPDWKEGAVYEIRCCNHEAYDFDIKPIMVTIGVTEDGKRYFKTVNGEVVDSSFQLNVRAYPRAQAPDPANERKPESERLKHYIEKANSYDAKDYTPKSYEALENAIANTEQIMNTAGLKQEEYNQAGADLMAAIKNLSEKPDTLALERTLEGYYTENYYTTDSWKIFADARAEAQAVYEDENATQAEVDKANADLKKAQNTLVLRGDKEALTKKVEAAKKVNSKELELGYNDLVAAIAKADAVLGEIDATQADVKAAEKAIDDAMAGLYYLPKEESWDCTPSNFKAKVVDREGKSVAGVPYKLVSGQSTIIGKSNSNGMIIISSDDVALEVESVVTIDGAEYNCTDVHKFVASPQFVWTYIKTLDGSTEVNGTYITYVVDVDTKSIESESVSIALENVKFKETGSKIEPEVTLKDGDTDLVRGKDFTVSYENNVEKGFGEITINGMGHYRGTVIKHFAIVEEDSTEEVPPTPDPEEPEQPAEPDKPVEPEQPEVKDDSKQLYGTTRTDTAIKSADEIMQIKGIDKWNNIIVASASDYPDALTGSYLAKVKNAPILLVDSTSEGKIKSYISEKLAAGGNVYILGGKGAVSTRFENSLSAYNVTRLGGQTRYDTNIRILEEAGVYNEDLLVCTANGYADSLSASASGKPILLVGKTLTAKQKEFLSNLESKNVYAIGGSSVVSDSIMKNVQKSIGSSPMIQRVAGQTRYATSAAVARTFFNTSANAAVLAYGENFPDGLSGGPLAMAMDAPLLLVTNNANADAKLYCKEANVTKVVALGGPMLISEKVWSSMTSK